MNKSSPGPAVTVSKERRLDTICRLCNRLPKGSLPLRFCLTWAFHLQGMPDSCAMAAEKSQNSKQDEKPRCKLPSVSIRLFVFFISRTRKDNPPERNTIIYGTGVVASMHSASSHLMCLPGRRVEMVDEPWPNQLMLIHPQLACRF